MMECLEFEVVERSGDNCLSNDMNQDMPSKASQASLEARVAGAFPGVVIGEFLALADEGTTPLVMYPGQLGGGALRAISTIDLSREHVGCQVTLLFERGDPARPVVIGVVRTKTIAALEMSVPVEFEVDGRQLLVSAKEQIVLSCGDASITLTSAGKVLIRGTYVRSESAGVNRIQGGSVQIN